MERRGKGKGRGSGSLDFGGGRGRGGSLAPPPRPGFDEDRRLADVGDDPRYFDGAELGKAQKAALGIHGLTGRNTASFDPNSTLVRPLMRVYHAPAQKRFGKEMKPDDVIAVPDFLCKDDDTRVYESLSGEIREAGDGFLQTDACQSIVRKICKYYSIAEEGAGVRVAWCRGASAQERFLKETKAFKAGSNDHNCTASISVGSPRELAFRRLKTGELVYITQANGQLVFVARDIGPRFEHGAKPTTSKSEGHISITVAGHCAKMTEDTLLAPVGSQNKPAEKASPCRDFKLGRCSFGDRCRFSHGEAEENGGGNDGQLARFDPAALPDRPAMRVITVPKSLKFKGTIRHDDVVIVPEFFCGHDDWDIYYQLIKEMREVQARGERKSEWIPWHEGAHLLSQNPVGSKTFQSVLDKCADFFHISEGNRGTRFNWYRDGSDWKPFHHDSAAFNAQRAKNQNCTVGISFGASRELAFRHAKTGEVLYFPQTNGMLFFFGRDANIVWQHGINALPEEEQDGKGRISVVLWGWSEAAVDEEGSPPMLDDNSRGNGHNMHGSGKGGGKGGGKGKDNVCRDFQRGSCNYGDRCRFSHEVTK